MADDTFQVHDTRLVAIDRVLVMAGQVVHHWHEFGPEYDFARVVEGLEQALKQWNRFWPEEVRHG